MILRGHVKEGFKELCCKNCYVQRRVKSFRDTVQHFLGHGPWTFCIVRLVPIQCNCPHISFLSVSSIGANCVLLLPKSFLGVLCIYLLYFCLDFSYVVLLANCCNVALM